MSAAVKPAIVHQPLPHDSAIKHVTGTAAYIDDILEPQGCLQIGLGLASIARGRIVGIDLSAVAGAPGVVRVITRRMFAARMIARRLISMSIRSLPKNASCSILK